MMRGRRHYAVAVRLRSGEIAVKRGELTGGLYTSGLWRLPVLRGLALMAEQLHLGTRCLTWSAAAAAGEPDAQISRGQVIACLTFALVIGLAVFVGLPLLGAGALVHRSGSLWFVPVEGVIRVGLVLGYLALLGRIADVRRLFQYHGAEHKTINAFEAGEPLDVAHVRGASVLHPRCGTGFLIVVLVVSVLVFSVVAVFHPAWPALILTRVLGVPLVAGLSYECIRLMAGHRRRRLVRLLLVPVLATQRLTTREPDAGMLEVAIAAFQAAREGEAVAA